MKLYCDADWAGDIDHRHSFSGLVVYIESNVTHSRSTKQKCIATSTMKAEYIAMSTGVKETIWV